MQVDYSALMRTEPPANFVEILNEKSESVVLNPERWRKEKTLVLQIIPNHFQGFSAIITGIWGRLLIQIEEDRKKGKAHLEKICSLLALPGAAESKVSACWNKTEAEKLLKDPELVEETKKGVLKVASTLITLYQAALDQKSRDELRTLISHHAESRCCPSFPGVTLLERETVTEGEREFLGLSPEEITEERNIRLDCGSWAIMALRIETFAAEIKKRYLAAKQDDVNLSSPNALSYLKKKGFRVLDGVPAPGDLVIYRNGVNPYIDKLNLPKKEKKFAETFFNVKNPNCPKHYGFLDSNGYVISKLMALGSDKIYRHKIWHIHAHWGCEAVFLRHSSSIHR